MSDTVLCDVCGKPGNRKLRRVAPFGWSWGVARIEDEADELIVYACSPQCQQNFWKIGPGRHNLATGDLSDTPYPDEKTLCSECREPQFMTTSGITCKNGHGGAPGVAVST